MSELYRDTVSQSILKTLLYFDIFDYPLESREVYKFLQTNHVTEKLVEEKLYGLANAGLTFRFGKFFSLHNKPALIDRRVNGNNEAVRYMDLAHQQACLIQKFPFVKAVLASGSLSKGYMDDTCDLDFFIITQSNRLWIARTLLVLYKRFFLGNSHKYFCVNYFVDESHLEIEEKNLYTATELTTLIPLTGLQYYKKLMAANQWIVGHLPNSITETQVIIEKANVPIIKRVLENISNLLFPQVINNSLMKLTLTRWRKLYADKYNRDDFKIAFKTKENVSKNHPNYYQKKVMDTYHQKRSEFSDRYHLNWKP